MKKINYSDSRFYSEITEQNLIGAIILEPKNFYTAKEILEDKKYFHSTYCAIIYEAMEKLILKNKQIDAITIKDEILFMNINFDIQYMSEIIEKTVSYSNAETYAKEIKQKYIMRELWKASLEVQNELKNNANFNDILVKSQNLIFNICSIKEKGKTQKLSEILPGYLENIEKKFKKEINTNVIETNIHHLNQFIGGWNKTDLIIIAGRPGMGKTAVALNFGIMAALLNEPVLMFSLEMSKELIINRAISLLSEMDQTKFQNCNFNSEDWQNIISSADKLYNMPFFLNDSCNYTVSDIISISKKIKLENGLRMIIIDYIGYVKLIQTFKFQNKTDMIGDVSKALKQLAKELDCTVLLLSQVSREVESRKDKHPLLSDLRDSGNLEQDADKVIFPYRDEYYNPSKLLEHIDEYSHISNENIIELDIAKNKNGKTGKVIARFIKESMCLKNFTDENGNVIWD